MSKRLQVVMNDAELRTYQRLARSKGIDLSEWVRQRLRDASRAEPKGSVEKKIAAVRSAVGHSFPAPDLDQMLREIAAGYRQDTGA